MFNMRKENSTVASTNATLMIITNVANVSRYKKKETTKLKCVLLFCSVDNLIAFASACAPAMQLLCRLHCWFWRMQEIVLLFVCFFHCSRCCCFVWIRWEYGASRNCFNVSFGLYGVGAWWTLYNKNTYDHVHGSLWMQYCSWAC